MINCKHCHSTNNVKNGMVQGKQRYLCKDCNRTFREGDLRENYTEDQRMRAIKWYLEGAGIRSIERMEKVPASLVVHWIRKASDSIRKQLSSAEIPADAKDIQILELDELFTYCKKKQKRSTYGLLLIGSEVSLLTLK